MEKFEQAKTLFLEGLFCYEQEKYADAEIKFRDALNIIPDRVSVLTNLSATLIKLEKFEEAQEQSLKALALDTVSYESWLNLGTISYKSCNYIEAAKYLDKALQINPEYAEGYNNRGNALHKLKRFDDSILSFYKAISLSPDYADAYINLGNVFFDTDRPYDASANFRYALRLNPRLSDAHYNLGNVLQKLGIFVEAEESYLLAVKNNPNRADAHYNLGNLLGKMGRLQDAEDSYRKALQIQPDMVDAYNNLGKAIGDLGRLQEAEEAFLRAQQIKPDFVYAYNNLMYLNLYNGDKSTQDYLADACRFGKMARSKVVSRFTEWTCTQHPIRLRVGLVSGDFRKHPVGYFLESTLTRIDSNLIELIAYQTFDGDDELTARIKPYFNIWRNLADQSDESAARQIHIDSVHILFDLSGHTEHNRLPVFAWKPAPIQVGWLGFLASTGLEEMDYFLGDPYVAPNRDEYHFIEKFWHFPESHICLTEPDVSVDTGALPALQAGYITFGCLNNLAKMNEATLALWSKVLKAVPGSKLLFRSKLLTDAKMREAIIQRYARYGISEDRLILEGAVNRTDYFRTYQRIDIALDPFPYTGCTTTLEGLWMGVPFITKKGDRFLSRVGESIAHNAGLPDWIAADEEEYVALAVKHASDLSKLALLRAGLRSQVLVSPLFDATRFARHFEKAMWGMWQKWLERDSG